MFHRVVSGKPAFQLDPRCLRVCTPRPHIRPNEMRLTISLLTPAKNRVSRHFCRPKTQVFLILEFQHVPTHPIFFPRCSPHRKSQEFATRLGCHGPETTETSSGAALVWSAFRDVFARRIAPIFQQQQEWSCAETLFRAFGCLVKISLMSTLD